MPRSIRARIRGAGKRQGRTPVLLEPGRRAMSGAGSESPTDGERAFAWAFAVVYVTLIAVVAGVLAAVVTGLLLRQAPSGLGFLLGLVVLGLTPHAAAAVAATLAETRGLSASRRLLKILAAIHA